MVADCATDDGRAALLAATAAIGSPVAAFVHAAGADLVASLAETTADQLDELLAINVRAPFLLTQAAGPDHGRRRRHRLRRLDLGDARPAARHAAYGASKAALIGLTANLAAELGPRLRVNCVSPGATRTGMLRTYVRESMRGLSDDERARLAVSDAARMPLGPRRRARRGGHRLRPPGARRHRGHRRRPSGRRRLHRDLTVRPPCLCI